MEMTVINVKVPKAYAKKKYLDAIGMGLFDLATGVRPEQESIALGEVISVKLKLSHKAQSFWDQLLPKYEHNQRRIAREALCLISQEPEYCLKCRI